MATDCDSSKTELPNWVIHVDKQLSQTERLQPKAKMHKNGKRCIYRVPDSFHQGDEHLYKTCFTSFGPYQTKYVDIRYYEYHELQDHKILLHFLNRTRKSLVLYYNAVALVVKELKDAYDQLAPEWQDNDDVFLKLMVIHGCKLIEILCESRDPESYYASDSPILHMDPHEMDSLRNDMLLLENQLPLLLLEVLLDVETGGNYDACEILEDGIAKMFSLPHVSIRYDQNNKCKHILDVYRKSLLDQVRFKGRKACNPKRSSRATAGFHDFNIPSAKQLDNVGIGFTTSDTRSLMDISFRRQTLRLPHVVVDSAMKSRFLNIIVFEKLHVDAGNKVISYVYFMGSLVQDAKDVSLLHSRGIINSELPDDEVVSMFHRLFQDISHDPDKSLVYAHWKAGRRLRQRFNKMSNEWRKDLYQNYLRSPWTIISVIVASLLFTLSIIQTIYTVLSYVNRNS